MIALPLSMCILAHRSGAIRGLRGQTDWLWDICGDLRMSVSLEEEEAGIALYCIDCLLRLHLYIHIIINEMHIQVVAGIYSSL